MLADQFKRKIDYLRVSVTDRCDLRCTYCMAEDVTFLPRQEVLTIEEIIKLIDVFNEFDSFCTASFGEKLFYGQ